MLKQAIPIKITASIKFSFLVSIIIGDKASIKYIQETHAMLAKFVPEYEATHFLEKCDEA